MGVACFGPTPTAAAALALPHGPAQHMQGGVAISGSLAGVVSTQGGPTSDPFITEWLKEISERRPTQSRRDGADSTVVKHMKVGTIKNYFR